MNKGYNLNIYNDDGGFSPTTERAIRLLQECFNLAIDGIIGRGTWRALYGLDKGDF